MTQSTNETNAETTQAVSKTPETERAQGGALAAQVQYDPGQFKLVLGAIGAQRGALGVVGRFEFFAIEVGAIEIGALARAATSGKVLAAGGNVTFPGGINRPVTIQAQYEGIYVNGTLSQIADFDYHQFDITVDKKSTLTAVGAGRATGPEGRLFDQGWYEVHQGNRLAGLLAVEYAIKTISGADTVVCHQYWFLNTRAVNGGPVVYTTPSQNNPDVTTTITWQRAFDANQSFQTVLDAPTKPQLIFCVEEHRGFVDNV